MSKKSKKIVTIRKFDDGTGDVWVIDGQLQWEGAEAKLSEHRKECMAVLDLSPNGENIKGVGRRDGDTYFIEEKE